jgi:Ni,Fe-hydrogenase I large subunit
MFNVLWLQSGGCGGCSISLLNAEAPDLMIRFKSADINLLWHPSLSESSADEFVALLDDIITDKIHLDALCLEGSVMRGPNGTGRFHMLAGTGKSMMSWLNELSEKSDYTLAMGSCAAFGGVTAAGNNPGDACGVTNLDSQLIQEDISHSWMLSQNKISHPYDGVTQPDPEQDDGYSWCKAPRYDGQVIEVGALARQTLSQHPLVLDLVDKHQSNVTNRIVARMLELARVIPEMENWCRQIKPNQPFNHQETMPKEAEGVGLVEVARGSLGHWIRIEKGKILNYQIIAPTTWNFSPRDKDNVAGALEQALLNTAVGETGNNSVAIQHIVRSFDPCMVCTVH